MEAVENDLFDAKVKAAIDRVFSKPLEIPQEWLSWLISYIESHPPILPISQIHGFNAFTAQIAQVATAESRNNGAYGDLATVGPSITGLSKGRYLLAYGAQAQCGDNNVGTQTLTAYMAPSVNGAAPSDADAARSLGPTPAGPFISVMSATIKDLPLNDNTVKAQYKISAATVNPGFWGSRFLIALRVSNL